MSFIYFPCDISLYRRSNFAVLYIHAHSQDAGSNQYFDELEYLHFVQMSDAKVIASRFPAAALNVRNDDFASKILNEEETGLHTVMYAKERTKKENKHIKYNLTLYFGTSN